MYSFYCKIMLTYLWVFTFNAKYSVKVTKNLLNILYEFILQLFFSLYFEHVKVFKLK